MVGKNIRYHANTFSLNSGIYYVASSIQYHVGPFQNSIQEGFHCDGKVTKSISEQFCLQYRFA